MHELSVASAVLDTVRRHAHGRRVTLVSLRVGRLRQVVPDSLRFYFEIVARDTICEDAGLELSEIEARLSCSQCGHQWEPVFPAFRCPECASAEVVLLSGEELEVEYIEVEESHAITADEQETECTGPR
jgi:hydrogenase nickel incorporation protein HypA/HybF